MKKGFEGCADEMLVCQDMNRNKRILGHVHTLTPLQAEKNT